MTRTEWQLQMNDLCDRLAVAVIDQHLANLRLDDPDHGVHMVAVAALEAAERREREVRTELVALAIAGIDAGHLRARSITAVMDRDEVRVTDATVMG